jgi:hypothetical protein
VLLGLEDINISINVIMVIISSIRSYRIQGLSVKVMFMVTRIKYWVFIVLVS